MKKLFVRMLVTAILSVSACVAWADVIDSGTCGANGGNLMWSLSDDYVLTISGSGEMEDYCYEDEDGLHISFAPWFSYRNDIKSLALSGMTSIGGNAFYGCSSLTNVAIPSSVTSIEGYSFSHCSSLASITIPSSVTSIGNDAFSGCSSLTSVMIPGSVKSIGSYTFSGCCELTSLTIPSSVTSIGNRPFKGCYVSTFTNNSSLDAEANNYWGACVCDVTSDGLCIYNNSVVHCRRYAVSVTIPSSVTSIGSGAFAYCSSLVSVTIPKSVTSVGGSAFLGCERLASIVLPKSVSYLAETTFNYCNNLKCITLLGVETIDYSTTGELGAFEACPSLKVLRMPEIDVVLTIDGTFGSALSSVYLGSDPYSFDKTWVKDVHVSYPPLSEDGILYVPIGSKVTYQADEKWGRLYPNIEEYDLDDPYGMYENAIYVEDDAVRAGGKVTLSIKMKNKETATGYEFTIVLPRGVDANDVMLTRSKERKEDEVSFTYGIREDGTIKVVGYATDSQPFESNDGEIATLTMTIPEDMDLGEQPLVIQEIEITNNGQPEVIYDQLITWLTVEDYLLGDANCDKRVSVSDLSIVVNHILNVNIDPEVPYNANAADANEDKRVSVSDLSTIVNYIIYGNPDGPSDGKARDEMDAQSFYFSTPDFTINPGEESTLYLQLANSVDVTAFQFDAILPEGLTCTQAKRVAARVGEEHSFQSSLMDEQTRRVVCYSSTNANIEGNEGAIVELTIKAADNLQPGLYTLSLEGLEVVCHNQGMTLDNVALSIEVVDADGIEELQQDQTVKTRYDLMGRSTARPQHGIYFENGRKVMVK